MCALPISGLRLALIEGASPDDARQPSFDDRTTALGNGTRRIFEALGVWPRIAPQAAPIRSIHVSDAGRFGFARLEAAELGLEAFGFVATNRTLGAALRERLAGLRTARGGRFDLVELPMPEPFGFQGQRVPASYANFLIINGAVLVPMQRRNSSLAACAGP